MQEQGQRQEVRQEQGFQQEQEVRQAHGQGQEKEVNRQDEEVHKEQTVPCVDLDSGHVRVDDDCVDPLLLQGLDGLHTIEGTPDFIALEVTLLS